ncbi:MAG: hypothetical protein Tsb002_11520 [Wenzhouxiangellaceae bacterium]
MNKVTLLLSAAMLMCGLNAAQAAGNGNPAAGQEKSATCQACHGADGNQTLDNTYPKLGGQYADYLQQSLRAYRSGTRKNPVMMGFAAQLSDQDIADLAAWYASQDGLNIIPKKP